MLLLIAMLAVQDAPVPQALPAAAPKKVRGPRDPEPLGNPFTRDDYPPEAARKGETGRFVARVEVDARGTPINCTPVERTDSAQLNQITCPLILDRARFSPAIDRRGRAVAGSYEYEMRWALPPRKLESYGKVMRASIDGENRVTQCTMEYRSAENTPPPRPCGLDDQPPGHFIASMRGVAAGPFEMISYTEQRVDGLEPPPPMAAQPAFETVGRSSYSFEVGEDGAIANCREAREYGPAMYAQVCGGKVHFARTATAAQAGRADRVRVSFVHMTTGQHVTVPRSAN